jgi:hypothetical protein
MTIVNPLNNSIEKMLRYTPPDQSVTSIAAKRCADNRDGSAGGTTEM